MPRINIDHWCHSLFYFAVILLASISSIKATVIIAQTLEDFRNAGWVITGSNPTTYKTPGAWKAALQPLDAGVTGGSVWRVTSSSDTIFRFGAFESELCAKNIKLEVTYFMENTLVSVYPSKDPAGTGSEYFHLKQPNDVRWFTETIDIRPGNAIEFKINVLPGSGGYVFFDQISIDHDVAECDPVPTTDTTRTTEGESEWTELPSTTESSTTSDPLTTTTSSPECPTTPPEPCNCCNRCPERTREIHHHHYYPFPNIYQ